MSTYNGWTNYETWAVNLWLGNDAASDGYWREIAQECWNDAEPETCFTRAERATLTLADRLKDEIENGNPLAESASLFSDLLHAAVSEVNWYEIAEHFIADVDQTCEESDEYEQAIDNPRDFLSDVLIYCGSERDAISAVWNAQQSLPERLRCDQCQMLAINGIPCHETGCPNQNARWDSDCQEWVRQRKCFECGCEVDADNSCCSEPQEEE